MGFFAILNTLIEGANVLLPAIAQIRAVADPTVTNQGLINTGKVLNMVSSTAQHVEQVAAASPTPMTAMDKLQLAKDVLQSVHQDAVATNVIPADSKFEEYWGIASTALGSLFGNTPPAATAQTTPVQAQGQPASIG